MPRLKAAGYVREVRDGILWMIREADRKEFLESRLSRPDLLESDDACEVLKELRIKRLLRVEVDYAGQRAPFLVKIYRPLAGWPGLRRRMRRSRAARELGVLLEARRRGLATISPLAAGERREVSHSVKSYFIVEQRTDLRPLDEALESLAREPRVRHRLLKTYGEFARRVHERGIYQDDFDPNNILVEKHLCAEASPKLLLIDFERARLGPPSGLREEDRLWTLTKLNRYSGSISLTDRIRFLKAYAQSQEGRRLDWKELARNVREEQGRLFVRDCRRASRNCLRPSRNFARFGLADKWGIHRRRFATHPALQLETHHLRSVCEQLQLPRRLESEYAEKAEVVLNDQSLAAELLHFRTPRRARRAWQAFNVLLRARIPSVLPLFFCRGLRGFGALAPGAVATICPRASSSLASLLQSQAGPAGAATRRELLFRFGELIAVLERQGLYLTDLRPRGGAWPIGEVFGAARSGDRWLLLVRRLSGIDCCLGFSAFGELGSRYVRSVWRWIQAEVFCSRREGLHFLAGLRRGLGLARHKSRDLLALLA